MELNQPAAALPHLEEALQWSRILVEREPNHARYARDWNGAHSEIGLAQIALGRFDVGLTNLQEGVRLAENLIVRDPMNGSFQVRLIDNLQQQAKGLAKIAHSPGSSPVRQVEFWRQAIQSLTRCQERLAAPELERIRRQLTKQATEIAQALNEARSAQAKISGDAEAKPAKP